VPEAPGHPHNHAQARHWFQKAAAAGSAAAMHNLGAMHEHGHGVAHARARGWYRQAAEAGDGLAAERLYRLGGAVAPKRATFYHSSARRSPTRNPP
jgi:TPR repeat protein